MASTTTNLGLTKPASGEAYNIDIFNQNFQKIDDAHHVNYTKIATQVNANSCTIDRLLQAIKYWEGEDISLLTNRPSELTTSGWPFLLEVKHFGFYNAQTLYVFATNSSNPFIYYRQQGYTNGSVTWGNWRCIHGRTSISLTITNSKITSAERKFAIRTGDVVVIDLSFTVGTAITGTTDELFSGLPAPASGIRFRCFNTLNNNTPIRLSVQKVSSEGRILNAYSTGGIPAGTYEGQAVYIVE